MVVIKKKDRSWDRYHVDHEYFKHEPPPPLQHTMARMRLMRAGLAAEKAASSANLFKAVSPSMTTTASHTAPGLPRKNFLRSTSVSDLAYRRPPPPPRPSKAASMAKLGEEEERAPVAHVLAIAKDAQPVFPRDYPSSASCINVFC